MPTNLFITQSTVPPARWVSAFAEVQILKNVPATVPSDTLVWFHNQGPESFSNWRGKFQFVVLDDTPSEVNGLNALANGAVGYANSHSAPEVLVAIESVVRNNGVWVGPALLQRLLRSIDATNGQPIGELPIEFKRLSGREGEVALKIARGESNKEVARELNIAERTVKAHLTSAFEKLGVRDRLQLAILLRKGGQS